MYKNLLTIIIAVLFTSCSKYSHDIENLCALQAITAPNWSK
jgi:hypothetical protein